MLDLMRASIASRTIWNSIEQARLARGDYSPRTSPVKDGDTAVSTVVTYLEGTFHDQPFAGLYHYIRFWKIIDRQWMIVGGSVCAVSQ